MTQLETVDELVEYLNKKADDLTSEGDIARNEEKLELLKEWQDNHFASIELADGGCLDKSDKLDDRCIEIEEHFEIEYGIKFDSYGDMYE